MKVASLAFALAAGLLSRDCDASVVRFSQARGAKALAMEDANVTRHHFATQGLLLEVAAGKPDYNEETYVTFLPVSVEVAFALAFVTLVGSVPFILIVLLGGGNMTRAHILESVCLIMWLGVALFMFTTVLQFNSSHWEGPRPLTIVEAVYLLAQILTTVGYGDITPAFPRGQVWVAANVILALCLYGSCIMEVTDRINQRLTAQAAELIAALERASHPDQSDEEAEAASMRAGKRLMDWNYSGAPVDMTPLIKSGTLFLFFCTVGVFFWHFFPGEGKTWLQAVYMSIITLSTVGFGFFNATTEGGKVFSAFWMMFGVATLAATIAAFCELMSKIKAKERRNVPGEKLKFFRLIKNYSHVSSEGSDKGMDSYDFLKFCLVMNDTITEEELTVIEGRFDHFGGAPDGAVAYQKVFDAECLPRDFHAEAARFKKEGRGT